MIGDLAEAVACGTHSHSLVVTAIKNSIEIIVNTVYTLCTLRLLIEGIGGGHRLRQTIGT